MTVENGIMSFFSFSFPFFLAVRLNRYGFAISSYSSTLPPALETRFSIMVVSLSLSSLFVSSNVFDSPSAQSEVVEPHSP